MQLLAGFATDFANLFTNYKVDMIEVFLWSLWETSNQPVLSAGAGTSVVPMMVTRINDRYVALANTLAALDTADLHSEMAQMQMKTRTQYGSAKPLVIRTKKPRVFSTISASVAGGVTEVVTRRQPWLSITGSDDVEFAMNTLLVAEQMNLNGTMPANIYEYRTYTRVHFRCSQVV